MLSRSSMACLTSERSFLIRGSSTSVSMGADQPSPQAELMKLVIAQNAGHDD